MTIGPTVGTGLFIGSGQALAAGGPASLVGSYVFISILVYCLTTAAAEIASHMPATEGTLIHPYHYASPHLGFSLGYLRWYSTALLVPFEITSAMVAFGDWHPSPQVAIRVTIMMILILGFNLLPERIFKRSEMFFTGVKLLTTSGLGLVSIYLAIDGGAGFHYWRDPGAMNEYLVPGALGRFYGLIQSLLCSTISFILSPELTVRRSEQTDSRHSVLHLSQVTIGQLVSLYTLSSVAISIMAPFDEDSLTNGGIGVGTSPYVVGMRRAHIPILPWIATLLICASSVASGRSFLFSSSRMLCSLAETGHAPSVFHARNRYGVPYVAILTTGLISATAYLSVAVSSSAVFNLLMYFITTSGYISWAGTCGVYVLFRQTTRALGFHPAHQAYVQPYGAYFALCISLLLTLGNLGFGVNIPVYVGMGVFVVLYGGHRVWGRWTVRRELKETEAV